MVSQEQQQEILLITWKHVCFKFCETSNIKLLPNLFFVIDITSLLSDKASELFSKLESVIYHPE